MLVRLAIHGNIDPVSMHTPKRTGLVGNNLTATVTKQLGLQSQCACCSCACCYTSVMLCACILPAEHGLLYTKALKHLQQTTGSNLGSSFNSGLPSLRCSPGSDWPGMIVILVASNGCMWFCRQKRLAKQAQVVERSALSVPNDTTNADSASLNDTAWETVTKRGNKGGKGGGASKSSATSAQAATGEPSCPGTVKLSYTSHYAYTLTTPSPPSE